MADNKNGGFITDAFIGALKKNDEMNKRGQVKTDEYTPAAANDKKDGFITDAFLEALK